MPRSTSQIRDTVRLLRRPVLFVWALYLALVPFYALSGGLPQPGDALILILVPMSFARWDGRLQGDSVRIARGLLMFTAWVCVVNLAWAAVLSTWVRSGLFSLYYLYNAAFFLSALVLYQRFGDDFIRLTTYTVWAMVAFQVFASFAIVRGSGRSQLFFHNPNQLGYYALLSACVIALTQRRLGIGLVRSGIGLMFCGYLAVLSNSRSSVASIALLAMLTFLSNPRVLIVGGLIAAALTVLESPIDDSVSSFQQRIAEKSVSERTFFEDRGYDRIWNNPEYVLLGAGEGASKRFADSTAIGGAEIHSSIGTLLFSYGVIGISLFGVFFTRLMRGVPLKAALVLLPPLLYSFAHHGLRFTMLWVLLAIFLAFKKRPAPQTGAGPPHPSLLPPSALQAVSS